MKTNIHNRGAVLLIAVLMTSVVLSVGLGIYERTYKSIVFSSFWKQTQAAFAAADAGYECGMHLDLHPSASACFGVAVDRALWPQNAGDTKSIDLTLPTGACVNILISKQATSPFTRIEARGYNTCSTSDTRRVERGLKIDY